MISCITPSFNKTQYIGDAIRSVLSQTFTDFQYWIIENSTDMATKARVHTLVAELHDSRIILIDEYPNDKGKYPTAVILNKYFPLMKDRIAYLSDDDIFLPECFATVAQNPAPVVYWELDIQDGKEGNFSSVSRIKAATTILRGSNADCMLDGGQVVFARNILDEITPPYFPELFGETAFHCDGIFLNKLLALHEFIPINKCLSIKRRTSQSVFVGR